MPNIIEISPSCPSSCALIGSASSMRDFLLSKNLPDVPSDIITAGLSSEWYNDGKVATIYENFDPQTLTNPGDVFNWGTGNINDMRTKHQTLNLYDDYEQEHYGKFYISSPYDNYYKFDVDDSIEKILLKSFGDVEKWTDQDNASGPGDNWENRWVIELNTNKFHPGNAYKTNNSSSSHGDYVFNSTDSLPFKINNSTIDKFLYDSETKEQTKKAYYEENIDKFNQYHPITLGYNKTPADNDYMDYGNDSGQLTEGKEINSTKDYIDIFTTPDGSKSPWEFVLSTAGAREWLSKKNKYHNNPDMPYMGILSVGVLEYDSGVVFDVVGNSNIYGFTVNNEELSVNGIIEGSSFSPGLMTEYYCANLNIYGGDGSITSWNEKNAWKDFIGLKVPGCLPYINGIISPDAYGIQTFKQTQDVSLDLLSEYLPPQTTINLYENGQQLNLEHFGITSNIQTSIGNIFTTNPVPFDAIIEQLDKKLDTPLGKLAKQKLASEFFNRINLSIRQEAFGRAEVLATGIKNLAGNLVSKVIGRENHPISEDLNDMVDAFQNFEISVPKSGVGRAANFISSLGGINIKLDPIKEPIRWTSNVAKTEEDLPEVNTITDVKQAKRGFWNSLLGIGEKTSTDPSEVLLSYTSNGQRDFIRDSVNINEYRPYYQVSGFQDKTADDIGKIQRKKDRTTKKIERNNKNIQSGWEQIKSLEKENSDYETNISNNSGYSNKVLKIARKEGISEADAQRTYITGNEKRIYDLKLEIAKVEKENTSYQSKLNEILIMNPLPFYPMMDDGTFNTQQNSGLLSYAELGSTVYYKDSIDTEDNNRIKKDYGFAQANVNTTTKDGLIVDINKSASYKYPLDQSSTNFNRYSKERQAGLAPESVTPSENILPDNELYYQVKDLVKHGINPGTEQGETLRGLNIKDDSKFGYNVYPDLDRLKPGLGRNEQYVGQSEFSVLESNGYTKISPLWSGDKYKDVQRQKDIVEKYSSADNAQYSEMVTLHRYMFSIENLAWKGFTKKLPWQERGPNGGRILWFPPYGMTINDVTNVSWGQENLIGRNEPIYTYNHTERSGTLSFKIIMDNPGYYDPNMKSVEPEVKQTEQPKETITKDAIFNQTTDSTDLIPPKSSLITWDITNPSDSSTNETYLYIFRDTSGSMKTAGQPAVDLFAVGGKMYEQLVGSEDNKPFKTQSDYEDHVFIFEDQGDGNPVDNITDGRFFKWFATPYYYSKDLTSLPSNIIYKSSGMIPQTTDLLTGKVIVIGMTNDSTPMYLNPDQINTEANLPIDITDFLNANTNYGDFSGIIWGYNWPDSDTGAKYNNSFNELVIKLFGDGTKNNNINLPSNDLTLFNTLVLPSWPSTSGEYDPTPPQNPSDVLGQKQYFKYCLDIGNKTLSTVTDDTSDSDILTVAKRTLAKNNDIPDSEADKINNYPGKISLLRKYFSEMSIDHPNHREGNPLMQLETPTSTTPAKQNMVDLFIGGNLSDDNYDFNFYNFLVSGEGDPAITGFPKKNNILKVLDSQGGSNLPLIYLQSIGGGINEVKADGTITALGWTNIKAVILGPQVGETSTDPNNPEDIQLPTNKTTTPLPANLKPWGIDVEFKPENPLNEFTYFQRLTQTDPIFVDAIKDKVNYFDPAFHSITPVGFNNRLNFLEQCARQGPSINNPQESGNFISANSNLAFGRPPFSVLRIGDFYHTRIAIETVSLDYEPLVFDLNPEGIGVQPMLANVTITFKYLGGSSLSGPITELQNAVSNNYFANVEFYNTRAKKAFERNVNGPLINTTNSSPLVVAEFKPTSPSAGGSITFNQPEKLTKNPNVPEGAKEKKTAGNTTSIKPPCTYCPVGYALYSTADDRILGCVELTNKPTYMHVPLFPRCYPTPYPTQKDFDDALSREKIYKWRTKDPSDEERTIYNTLCKKVPKCKN